MRKVAALPPASAFPSLGKTVVPTKTTLDFKKTVLKPATPVETAPAPSPAKKHVSITRYGDDGPEDYDGPPEFSEEEGEGEFNAHLASTRRRGDKGIW